MTQQFEREVEIAAQEAALAKAKAEQAEERARLAEAQKKVAEASEERREAAFSASLQRALAGCGLKPNPNYEASDLEAILRSSFKFEVSNDGTFRLRSSTGQYADVHDALRGWASDPANRKYFSQDSLRLLETKPDQLSKSGMTVAMKSAFIARHGLEAFSRLPQNPPTPEPSIDRMDAESWARLPVARRSEIVAQMGEEWLSEMLRMTRTRR